MSQSWTVLQSPARTLELLHEQFCIVVDVLRRFRASDCLHGRTWLLPLEQVGHILWLALVLSPKRAHELLERSSIPIWIRLHAVVCEVSR